RAVRLHDPLVGVAAEVGRRAVLADVVELDLAHVEDGELANHATSRRASIAGSRRPGVILAKVAGRTRPVGRRWEARRRPPRPPTPAGPDRPRRRRASRRAIADRHGAATKRGGGAPGARAGGPRAPAAETGPRRRRPARPAASGPEGRGLERQPGERGSAVDAVRGARTSRGGPDPRRGWTRRP